jgi:hypothetical protein
MMMVGPGTSEARGEIKLKMCEEKGKHEDMIASRGKKRDGK